MVLNSQTQKYAKHQASIKKNEKEDKEKRDKEKKKRKK
jgi:hypothetical protein